MNWAYLLLYAAPALPIAFTALALLPRARALLFRLLPIAPLPGLLAALLVPIGVEAPLPGFLLGAGLALGEQGRIFLGVSAGLWMLAGLFAQASISGERCERFAGFWVATLAGKMLLFVAADVLTFYLAFAMLSLAAFGLIAHYGTEEARRAARIYLVMAIIGETMLLLGLLVAVQSADAVLIAEVREALAESPRRDLAIGLLLAGFGLKAGLIPLHMWLPLAHPAAPVPASAALSGAIVKAGIFGLVSFLPLEAALPGWSTVLVAHGLLTAYGGVLLGVMQLRPKTVLAYSTLSQMGLVVVVIGSAFQSPGTGFALAAVALYSAHHSLAKGALFLSVGVLEKSGGAVRTPLLLVTALAALAVAGLPFTGGALAKLAIKGPLGDGPAALLVTLSAVGTTLLMLRFLQLMRRSRREGERPPRLLLLPFLACVAGALAVPWVLFPSLTELTLAYALVPSNLWGALWPLLVGAAILAGALRLSYRPPRVPEGDIAVALEAGFMRLAPIAQKAKGLHLPQVAMPDLAWVDSFEQALARWRLAGALLLVTTGGIALAVLV